MKVIDLLNKIAKGEEVPKIIKYNGLIYNWDKVSYLHYEDEKAEQAFLEGYRTDMCLNYEVEIIEEDKKIEKLDMKEMKEDSRSTQNEIMLGYKINEIIDKINEEK